MAVGLTDPPAPPDRPADWTEITRSFQLALDPRKLLVAALGVLAMSVGWWLLSLMFAPTAPKPDAPEYQASTVSRELVNQKRADGLDYTEADYQLVAARRYERDVIRYRAMNDLAGPNGRLAVLPWNEYRGPNPFIVLTNLAAGTSVSLGNTVGDFLSGTIPVLVEPIRKLFLPALKIIDPDLDFLDRAYLLLCLVWTVVVWAFAGGVITRIAAVQLGGKDRTTLSEAVRFTAKRYLNYVISPLAPLGLVAVVIFFMALYGLVALIPVLGDIVLYGLFWPLVLLGGFVMAIAIVGLIGYPLMYPTVSAEGSDSFDAVSRTYNYVFQAPWSFLWYNLVALIYGSLVVLFVVFVASLMVYLGKFAVSQAPFSERSGRNPDYLFVYAPEAFGWKELLVAGSPIAVRPKVELYEGELRPRVVYEPVNPAVSKQYMNDMRVHNKIGAGMVTFWLVAMMLLVVGFSYSYFWSAATVIYLLMRRKVDEIELDEVYAEDPLDGPGTLGNLAPGGIPGTSPTEATSAPPAGGVNLPTVPTPPNYSPSLPPPPIPMSPPPMAAPPVQSPPVTVIPSPVIPPKPVPAPTETMETIAPSDEPTGSEEPTMTLPAVSPPPMTEPPLFPPPTGELKKVDEFKKDDEKEYGTE